MDMAVLSVVLVRYREGTTAQEELGWSSTVEIAVVQGSETL
jgi:hypothetical protein